MKKVQLGNSSLHISELSLGCMSLPTTVAQAQRIIDTAIDAGIHYFDTADLYDKGLNEEIIGQLLAPHREQVVIATKVGNRWEENKEGWHWDASPKYIKKAVKGSLKRLGTDVIDLYQLHGGTKADDWPAIIDTFEELKKQGYIREYGISSIRPNVFIPFFEKSNAVSNMMQFNLLDRCAEEWFDQFNGASVVTRGTLAKGLLTADWKQRLKAYMTYDAKEVADVLTKLEAYYGSLHALAIAFNLHYDTIASTVIGASSSEQLLDSIKAYEQAQNITDFTYAKQILKCAQYKEHRPE